MGIRLHKRFGYGFVGVPEGVLNLVDGWQKIDGFFDFVRAEHPDQAWWLDSVTGVNDVEDLFMSVHAGDEYGMGDGSDTVVVTPPNLADECYSFDSAFNYAELERFAPECLRETAGFAYSVNTPIFPTEYEVVHVGDRSQKLAGAREREVYQFLREVQEGLVVDENYDGITGVVAAKMTDSGSPLGVMERYRLAPPRLVQAFCDYYEVFSDPDFVVELKPTVLYYWT